MSNLKKIEGLRRLVNLAVGDYVNKHFPVGLPEFYFEVRGYKGISKHKITGTDFNFPWTNKRPTNLDVEKVEKFCRDFVPSKENVFLHYRADNYSGAIKLSDLAIDKGRSLIESDLIPLLEEMKRKYEPRPGYIQCEYCREQRLSADIIQAVIISPNWKDRGYKSPQRNYCKDKPCASYDQMAHEG